jgi:hypothetical protein
MLQILTRFLTLNVMSEHPAVYWGLAAVWFILLMVSISSLRSLPLSTSRKLAWFALILFVPLFGLGIYALRCLILGDWSFFKPFFVPPKTAQKIATR